MLWRWCRPRRGDDSGMALVLVVGSAMILMLISVSALGYATASQTLSRHDQDWNGALQAAQAGVDDYIRHLNENDGYWRNFDCANKAMAYPGDSCSPSDTQVGWQGLYTNTPGKSDPAFHYAVNTTGTASDGAVHITSTGRVGQVTRTLEVAVSRGGSTQFVYYTDHEDADPANKSVYPTPPDSRCSNYWWDGRSSYNSSYSRCQEITFITGDVIDGRVHTNDTPLMTGSPKFLDRFETSDPGCKTATSSNDYKGCWRVQGYSSASPIFGVPPQFADVLQLPDNTDQMDDAPGCKYTGPTRIKFTSDGNMTVWSKDSNTSVDCGGSSPWGVSVPVPNNKVIYAVAAPSQHVCAPGEIGDGLPVSYTVSHTSKGTTYSITVPDANMQLADQYCGQGNIYLEGKLKGYVTVAAQNSIVVTGDITLAGGLSGPDLLGLVAGNSIEVMHPVYADCASWDKKKPSQCNSWSSTYQEITGSGYPRIAAGENGITIDASLQTLQHSFYVQQYDVGSAKGNLTVHGSIAQKWRGIVGQGSGYSQHGYTKDYQYDQRLKNVAPPYFPQWVNAKWTPTHIGEIPPAFRWDAASGAYVASGG